MIQAHMCYEELRGVAAPKNCWQSTFTRWNAKVIILVPLSDASTHREIVVVAGSTSRRQSITHQSHANNLAGISEGKVERLRLRVYGVTGPVGDSNGCERGNATLFEGFQTQSDPAVQETWQRKCERGAVALMLKCFAPRWRVRSFKGHCSRFLHWSEFVGCSRQPPSHARPGLQYEMEASQCGIVHSPGVASVELCGVEGEIGGDYWDEIILIGHSLTMIYAFRSKHRDIESFSY